MRIFVFATRLTSCGDSLLLRRKCFSTQPTARPSALQVFRLSAVVVLHTRVTRRSGDAVAGPGSVIPLNGSTSQSFVRVALEHHGALPICWPRQPESRTHGCDHSTFTSPPPQCNVQQLLCQRPASKQRREKSQPQPCYTSNDSDVQQERGIIIPKSCGLGLFEIAAKHVSSADGMRRERRDATVSDWGNSIV